MGSSDATGLGLSQRSRTWSGGEQEVLSFPVIAHLEDTADLLARACRSHRAQHQRFTGWRKFSCDAHGPATGKPLAAVHVVERARTQAMGLQLPRQAFSGGAGAPDVERSAAQRTAREVVRAEAEHRLVRIRRAGTRQADRRIPDRKSVV